MKTVNIKGKEYVEVNERLIHFRANYPKHGLLTEVIKIDPDWVVIKASIFDENNREVANGIAYEKSDSSFINKTSYVENCETSAWGRALGNFGIGITGAVASAEEVQNAIKNQTKKEPPKSPEQVMADYEMLCSSKGMTESDVLDFENAICNSKEESNFDVLRPTVVEKFNAIYSWWMEKRLT